MLCKAPRIGLDGERLIVDVSLKLGGDSGSTSVLTLERKDAYSPEPEVPEKGDPLQQSIKKDPGFRRAAR